MFYNFLEISAEPTNWSDVIIIGISSTWLECENSVCGQQNEWDSVKNKTNKQHNRMAMKNDSCLSVIKKAASYLRRNN